MGSPRATVTDSRQAVWPAIPSGRKQNLDRGETTPNPRPPPAQTNTRETSAKIIAWLRKAGAQPGYAIGHAADARFYEQRRA